MSSDNTQGLTHEQMHELGIAHGHDHAHNHTHTHDPEHKKKVINRLNRAIGHLESIKRMIEDDRDCSEVLIQMAAVRSAINNTGKVVLKEHINHCVVDAVETGDKQCLEDLEEAVSKFIK